MTEEGPNLPLSRLERVRVRNAWPGEATDVTPWLSQSENLELLAQTIGLDLDPESVTEQAVGDFSLNPSLRQRREGPETLDCREEALSPGPARR